MSLSLSESFTNDAATGTASYPTSGASGTATSANATVSVVYDAASRTYTITNGARSQSFAQGDIDLPSTTSRITVFKKTSGTTTDTLTLTKPGTSGILTYRYVGGGYWQRTVTGSTTISGEFDAFTYGVETLDNAIVRTGGASYDVDLLGIVARPDTLYSLSGSGRLTANFFDGQITGSNGTVVRETRADNGFPGRQGEWRFTGALSNSQNAISGTMSLYNNSTAPLAGPASGRFYGPGSDEIGIAFQGSAADGSRVVGTLLGRKTSGSIAGENPSLLNLQFDQQFSGTSAGRAYRVDPATGAQIGDDTIRNGQALRLAYRAGSQSFAVVEAGTDLGVYGAANLLTAESNARYAVYELRNGSSVSKLALYKSGSGNDEFALTYASFAKWQRTQPSILPGQTDGRTDYLSFGILTPNAAIPRTGTGRYDGIARGEAQPGPGSPLPLLTVEGTARLDFNFAAATFGGSMALTGINPANASRTDLGTFTFTNGILMSGAGFAEQGNFYSDINGNNGNRLRGYLMGPNAEELAASFSSVMLTPGTNSFGGYVQGAIVAKKTP